VKEKNVSNLTKTLTVLSLLAPVTAQSLGIGDIELHSALNQKLNAEVKLHLSGENPSDINVRLAPPEKFDQAGVPWSYFLSKIKFEPVVQPNGSVIVKISSKDALTEPFLNFLLEVSWPQGNLFREFTLLIDPPADYQTPSLPVAASDYAAHNEDWESSYERPVRKSSRAAKRTPRLVTPITTDTPTSGEYGPTRHQESLWGIAARLGSERGVGTQAMMDALYQANPDAFNRGDRNALKAGVSLKIPETDAILSGTGHAGRKAQKASSDKPTLSPGTTKALELVAPTEAKIADTAQIGEQPKTGSAADIAGSTPAEGRASSKDLELQSRIEKLEQQLNMMQQLLALKDQQLAALQNKDQTPATTPTEPTQPQIPASVEPPATPTITEPVAPAPITPAPPVEPVKPVQPAPVSKPQPVTPPPVAEKEDDSSAYYWAVGGLGGSILGLLGWLWWRKRKMEEQTNTDSMFASASQIRMPDSEGSLSVPVLDMASAASYDVGTVGESSFISDFTPSDFDAFDRDQGEVDPMSEADVYLAYGRYQQAEELIRDAIREQPTRDEFKLKLLEILYANESKDSFVNYAQELVNEGKQGNASFWAKVSEMGKELAPESVLFGGTVATISNLQQAASDMPANASSIADDDLTDLGIPDLASLNDIETPAQKLESEETETKDDDNGLDFDLGDFDSFAKEAQLDNTAATTQLESIDFDVSSPTLDSASTPQATEATKDEAILDDLEHFDFNFDLDVKEEQPAPESTRANEPLDLESFEFPNFGSTSENEITDNKAADVSQISSDDFDFNFDFDAPMTADVEPDDMDFGVSDLTDMDEYETKIDLAKAYIDMGDMEAARGIAEEVLAKGNKDQKFAAQALLDELK